MEVMRTPQERFVWVAVSNSDFFAPWLEDTAGPGQEGLPAACGAERYSIREEFPRQSVPRRFLLGCVAPSGWMRVSKEELDQLLSFGPPVRA